MHTFTFNQCQEPSQFVISTNFTYLDDLETIVALEVTCLHILFVGFPNCGV